jgi:hypothetical protein
MLRLTRDRSRATANVLASSPPARGVELDRLVALCLTAPAEMVQLYDSAWDQAVSGQIDDFQQYGTDLLAVLDATQHNLDIVRGWVRGAESTGQTVGRATDLKRAAEELVALRREIEDRWPWINEQIIAEAKAELARGEFLELDEAFAQIAGVDKETWLKRVEEHKKREQA